MPRAEADLWASAHTLGGLGELTAQWLEGRISSQPGYAPGHGPDEETLPLVPALAAANRAGYLTSASQPGHSILPDETDGTEWQQRAAVEGYVADHRADSLIQSARDAGLLVVDYPCLLSRWRRHRSQWIPVTIVRSRGDSDEHWDVVTSFGYRRRRRDIEFDYLECSPEAITEIVSARQVTIAETDYGGSSRLWNTLTTWAHA